MCQLSLINLGKKNINSLTATLMLWNNSRVKHKDGWGVFNVKGGILKTEIAGSNTTNAGKCIKANVLDDLPIIMHVRQASTSYSRHVDAEHAHPFESDNYILAHNGTLVLRNKEDEKEGDKDLIDSQIFLRILEEETKSSENYSSAIVKAINKFYGKFAFLIYVKKIKKFYVVRGMSATLFQIPIQVYDGDTLVYSGCIINTERESLDEILSLISSMVSYGLAYKLVFDETKIIAVEPESVNELSDDGKLKKLCDIKETSKPVATNYVTPQSNTTSYAHGYSRWEGGDEDFDENWRGYSNKSATSSLPLFPEKRVDFSPVEKKIYDLITKLDISVEYFDYLARFVIGTLLINASMKDEAAILNVMEKLANLAEGKTKDWTRIKNVCGLASDIEIHRKYGLKFPYMLNSLDVLRKLKNQIKGASDETAISL